MRWKLPTAAALILGAAFALTMPAVAADLPQSGTIKIHSSFKSNAQAVEVGKKHFMGSFIGWAVTYNDAGSGPLHLGAAMCTSSFDDINGSADYDGGRCAWGDTGGADKFFILWSGKGTDNVGAQGTGTITGGTGKYAGMQGKMAWQCKDVESSQDLVACTQQFDYQLNPATATR
jgi:hypothetical protein